ncbi:hypothetical protein CEP54_015374 [Fusarium duplospermum]|uniref:Uncharacterized protein n=1 Tax=Fusarium duplospermum TaxID=1325734 RepID=A0A428NPP2_9HYPO|nr:hypothetical protein CEP54_015374 [Fusarium duplospermum]
MNVLEDVLSEVSSHPLSSKDLLKYQKVVEALRRYWPNWSPLDQTMTACNHLLRQNDAWRDYATRLQELVHISDDVVTEARRYLAQTGEISATDIHLYLGLLRNSNTALTIAPVTPYEDFDSFFHTLDREKSWVVPVQFASSWGFAVVYPDCTHWYDSGGALQKPSLPEWPRPSCFDTEDTGVIMLLGIRLVANGLPHASNDLIEEGLPHFRARLLVELGCQKLDPDERALEAADRRVLDLLEREQEIHSSHFDDAWGDGYPDPNASPPGSDLDNGIADTTPGPAPDSALSGSADVLSDGGGINLPLLHPSSPDDRTLETVNHGNVPANHRIDTEAYVIDQQAPCRNAPAMLSRVHPQHIRHVDMFPRPISDEGAEMKSMLLVLSDAVLTARSTSISSQTSIPVLCNIIEAGKAASDFHYRYCQTRLYEKVAMRGARAYEIDPRGSHYVGCYMNQVRRRKIGKRRFREEGKLWLELCDICGQHGINPYSLLCAVPQRQRFSVDSMSILKTRLRNPNDPLVALLRQAGQLCQTIVEGNLPSYVMFIEVFTAKTFGAFSRDEFTAFTSIHRNALLPIPPYTARNRGRK